MTAGEGAGKYIGAEQVNYPETENGIFSPPNEVAGFELLKEIGRGTSGVVYLARQIQLERDVAIKLLMPEVAANPVYVNNFFREARTAAKLNHPNVVRALDVGTDNGICFFAMEYVNGRSLETIRIKSPELLTPRFLISMMCQLADAMDYAWNKFHLTHGDIKPENLLIRTEDNCLKLADLGLARVSGTEDGGDIMATPLYVSPEIVSGRGECGPRSDIYTAGAMLYELLAGMPPFDGTVEEVVHQHVFSTPRPLIEVNPDINRELSDYIGKMLEKSPENRPSGWSEVKAFLRKIEVFYDSRKKSTTVLHDSGAPHRQKKTDSGPSASRTVRKIHIPWGKVIIAAALLLLLSLLGGITVLMIMHH